MAKIVSYLYWKGIAKLFLREGDLVRVQHADEPGLLPARRTSVFVSLLTLLKGSNGACLTFHVLLVLRREEEE